jgi:hypothetical protein
MLFCKQLDGMGEPRETEKQIVAPCPKCGSNDVRRSESEGFYAALQRAFGRLPFRCRSCRARFYRKATDPNEMLDE